jgi:hypothetical protein
MAGPLSSTKGRIQLKGERHDDLGADVGGTPDVDRAAESLDAVT